MNTPQDIIDSIENAMRSGRKIEAIKIVRHATGMSLKDAKAVVDRKMGELKPEMINI